MNGYQYTESMILGSRGNHIMLKSEEQCNNACAGKLERDSGQECEIELLSIYSILKCKHNAVHLGYQANKDGWLREGKDRERAGNIEEKEV